MAAALWGSMGPFVCHFQGMGLGSMEIGALRNLGAPALWAGNRAALTIKS